jgi:hypothetical protein
MTNYTLDDVTDLLYAATQYFEPRTLATWIRRELANGVPAWAIQNNLGGALETIQAAMEEVFGPPPPDARGRGN